MASENLEHSSSSTQSLHKNYPLIATSMGHFLNDGMVFLVPVIIDLIAAARGINHVLIAISLVVFYLSTAVTANVFGRAIDRRYLQSWGMIIGIVVLSFGLILFSLALARIMISVTVLISSIVTGAGASLYHPTGTTILQSYYKGGRLGRYLGINGSLGSLGRAIYPTLLILVGITLVSNSYSVIFFGVLGLIVSIVMFLLIREFMVGEKNSRKIISQKSEKSQMAGSEPQTWKSALNIGIILLAVISLIRNLAFFSIVSWIPEYFSFVRGLGSSLGLGTMMTLMFSGGIVGQLVFGLLVEKHDKRLILALTTVFSVLFMFLYLYTAGILSIIALAVFGFFNFSGFPIFMSMIADYVPRGSTTVSNALVWNLGGTAGQAIGPLLVELIFAGDYALLSTAFEIMLILGLLSTIIVFALPKPSKVSRAPLFS